MTLTTDQCSSSDTRFDIKSKQKIDLSKHYSGSCLKTFKIKLVEHESMTTDDEAEKSFNCNVGTQILKIVLDGGLLGENATYMFSVTLTSIDETFYLG